MPKVNKKGSDVFNIKSSLFRQGQFIHEWLIFFFSFCLFANSIFNSYNLDDELVTINHHLTSRGIDAIYDIFTSPYYQDESGYSYEYRPVVLASFALEHQFFGDNAHISHFFNVLLYAFCCLVIYKVLQRLLNKYPPLLALGIALLFAAHPAHTEVVCSIKNRDEILGLLFSFMAFYVAIVSVKTVRIWLMFPVLLLSALALMSKVTVISLAIIIPLGLILFTEASLIYLTTATLAFSLPAFFVLTSTGGFEKVILILSVIFGVFVIYMIANIKSLSAALRVNVLKIRSIIEGDSHGALQNYLELPDFNYKKIYEQIRPDSKVWALYPAIITIGCLCLYIFCICVHYSMLGFLPALLLIVLAWRGDERFSWWAVVMIGACLTFQIISIDLRLGNGGGNGGDIERMVGELVLLYLLYLLVYSKSAFTTPVLIYFIVINVLDFLLCNNTDGIIFTIFILVLFRFKWLVLLALAYLYYWHELIPLVVASFFIFYFKDRRIVVPFLAVFTVALFYYNEAKYDHVIPAGKILTTLRQTSNQINPVIISSPQYRPLTFMEECVNKNAVFTERAGTSFEILFHYLYKVVLPYPMSFYYGYKFIYPQKLTETVPLMSLIIYALLFFSGLILLNKDNPLAFGIFIYLISISVFSNYFQPISGMLADRFLLIPSLGWIITLGAVVCKMFGFSNGKKSNSWQAFPPGVKYSFTIVLLLYSTITFSRNFDWKDNLTLFRHDIKYVNQSAQAHNLLGLNIMKAVQTVSDPIQKTELEKEALFHFQKAEEIYPYFFNVAYDIGRVYLSLDMPDSAIIAFRHSINLDSTYPDVYWNLGTLLAGQNKFADAKLYFESFLKLNPTVYDGYDQLSYIYFRLNQYDRSIAINVAAAQRFPNRPEPLINLARTYTTENRPDSAMIFLNKADALSPGNPVVQQLIRQTQK